MMQNGRINTHGTSGDYVGFLVMSKPSGSALWAIRRGWLLWCSRQKSGVGDVDTLGCHFHSDGVVVETLPIGSRFSDEKD